MENAIDKIRDEMAKKANHPGVSILGEYFTSRLQKEPEIAGLILQKEKTLEGAFNAIYDFAKKNRGGKNYAFVPPKQGLEIACQYFGLKFDGEANPYFAEAKQESAPAKPEEDELDLDALLNM